VRHTTIMGSGKKTFRDGTYYRHVWFGKRTVKQGECAAIWSPSGVRQLREGPQRVRLFFSHVRFLTRYVAAQDEYLSIQYRDGRKEMRRGPGAIFMDPCVHVSVSVEQAYKLAANEALVVYRETGTDGDGPRAIKQADAAAAKAVPVDANSVIATIGQPATVERRVVRGPAIFVPEAAEWVHQFSWHGSATEAKSEAKRAHALQFCKLRVMPDQMYVTVKDVRTKDDAQLQVHLMIFYEIRDIEKMLDASNDPIGDFINACTADVMAFGAANTYESLLERTEQLSDLRTFPTVKVRMDAVGYTLHKTVYRGYSTSPKLQAMHDEAIAKRTALRLQSATANVEQAEVAAKLKCKEERSHAEQQLAEAETRHKISLLSLEAEEARAQRDADHAIELRHERERAEERIQMLRVQHDEEVRRATALKGLGVDLTKLLCVAAERPPDQHVRIDSAQPTALTLTSK